MPAESVPWFDSQQPVSIRLEASVAQKLGVAADTDVQVETVMQQDGLLLIVVRQDATHITRYLLPPQAFLWCRQAITQSAPPSAPPSSR